MDVDPLMNTLLNFGLAGAVIYIFYTLLKDEMNKVVQSNEKLSEAVSMLSAEIRELKLIIDSIKKGG